MIGPSGLALMRRLPVLWTEREPARIGVDELAHSLGLGGGTAQNSRLQRTLECTVRFGLADWGQPGRRLSVYTEVPPLQGLASRSPSASECRSRGQVRRPARR